MKITLTLGTLAARLFKTASTYPRTSWAIHRSSSSWSAGFLAIVSCDNITCQVFGRTDCYYSIQVTPKGQVVNRGFWREDRKPCHILKINFKSSC